MTDARRKRPAAGRVYLEIGHERVFAVATEWPGWCRSARGEAAALEALLGHAERYRDALARGGVAFEPPAAVEELEIVGRHEGSGGTDFGVPSVITEHDERPLEGVDLERWDGILAAAWSTFDRAVTAGTGRHLRLGPRGGGRSLEAIVEHVRGADGAYLKQLGSRQPRAADLTPETLTTATRERSRQVLRARATGAPIEEASRVKRRWPPRTYVSRAAWHALDHAWEIEDRIT